MKEKRSKQNNQIKTPGFSPANPAARMGRIGRIFILILILTLVLALPGLSQDSASQTILSQLEDSKYSGFQKTLLADTAGKLITMGADPEEIEKILQTSSENHFDAYNVKKMFEVLIDAKENGLSEKSLVNKIKEGLAKRVDDRSIIDVLEKEAGYLKIAQKILREQSLAQNTSDEQMIEVLVESLNNGVPQQTLAEVFSKGVTQGKNPADIADLSTELGNLSLRASELGFTEEEILNVFEKAVASRSGVEGICEDIQDILVGAAAAKMKMASGKTSNTNTSVDSAAGILTGNTDTNSPPAADPVGTLPGSPSSPAPTDADDKPDTQEKPDDDNDSSSPPEN